MFAATENIRVFRMNFDDSSEMQGVYADIGDSLQTVPGGIVGNAELFDGKGNITIPFFKNNEFSEFTLSLWFNRDTSIPSGEEGLVSNGNDLASGCSPATISILSTGTSVSAGVITNLTVASIAHSNSVRVLPSNNISSTYVLPKNLDYIEPVCLNAVFAVE